MTKLHKIQGNNVNYSVDLIWEVLNEPSENFRPNSIVVASALVGAHGIAVCLPESGQKSKKLAQRLKAQHLGEYKMLPVYIRLDSTKIFL